jgi:hypothetical protein
MGGIGSVVTITSWGKGAAMAFFIPIKSKADFGSVSTKSPIFTC